MTIEATGRRVVEVPRRAVRRRLQSVLTFPVTVLRAPAGYGKSTVIRQSLPDWQAAGASVTVFDHDSLPLAGTLGRCRRAAQKGAPAVLVLDQLDALPESDWSPQTAATLHTLPADLHVVLVTRGELPPAIRFACEAAGYQTLGSGLLRFTPEECLALLRGRWSPRRAAALCDDLHQLTGGWPVAVAAAAECGRGDTSSARRTIASTNWNRYVRHELLEALPAVLREFLSGSVFLEDICGSLCDAALGRTDSDAAIERLVTHELLSPVPQEPGWFQHHPLLVETLRGAISGDDSALGKVVHRRAARWHAERNNYHRAVAHCLAVGDYTAAAEVLLGGPPARPLRTLEALVAVAAVRGTAAPELATLADPSSLTAREFQVLDRLAAGLANKDIARELSESVATVQAHTYRIFRKLGAINRIAAVATARRLGLVR